MKKLIYILLIAIVFFTSCEKTTTPVDGSNATITLNNNGAKFVTDNITVNAKDSIFFGYTITSNIDMRYVSIQKNPVNQTAFVLRDTLVDANKNSYTAIKKLVADSINGPVVYRIVAHDKVGNYIGHKDIIVTVATDFNFYTYRFLKVPDTTGLVNTCYLGARNGNVYNYSNGAANSSNIDLGIYYDTTGRASAIATDDSLFVVYALNMAQPQISFYDVSTWTKNATIMKRATSPTFASLTSAGALRTAAVTNLSSGARNRAVAVTTGSLIFFKTIDGKAGCLNVNFVNGATPASSTYMNVDVKIEK
jgi:hypothetical protein